MPDASLRDTENIPLSEEIDKYFEREILPFHKDSWVDKTKTKIGYEIPFTQLFYEFAGFESSADIAKRIEAGEKDLMEMLSGLFQESEDIG